LFKTLLQLLVCFKHIKLFYELIVNKNRQLPALYKDCEIQTSSEDRCETLDTT